MAHQIAVVTGTSSGVGAATARALVGRGWTVVGASRRAAAIDAPLYTHVTIDLADLDALPDAFEAAVAPILASRRWDRMALVNNAARADLLMPIERLSPSDVLAMLALNTVAPMWLMGFVVRHAPRDTVLRIVNVSTGAAVTAFPGLAAYGASKAALRMAGQVFAAELDSPARQAPGPADIAILSYQPGTVDTPMQTTARSLDPAAFPWSQPFHDFHARGLLVDPSVPAAEIVAFVESDSAPRLTERRLGAS
ncbi:MAG TPA: SDR family NAD(P)-dependent oxidoreductase [Vicinamibacterales bacterium]|nr:SDR family NAD(P)-dependent oxidoreductase [Vicinamibacterales bacterium]